MNTTQQQPYRAGQFVRNIKTGKLGMTTDAPRKRTPTIATMYQGAPYDVLEQIDELVVVELVEVA